jgi:hypothetical protein
MMTRRATVLLAAALLIGGGAALPACHRSGNAPPPDHIYTVRGRVETLPEPGATRRVMQIYHEAMPNFVRPDGTLGMESMSMPFPVAPGVSLEGIGVGDAVEFTWEYRKQGNPRYQVTAIRELPPETRLEFDPPGG